MVCNLHFLYTGQFKCFSKSSSTMRDLWGSTKFLWISAELISFGCSCLGFVTWTCEPKEFAILFWVTVSVRSVLDSKPPLPLACFCFSHSRQFCLVVVWNRSFKVYKRQSCDKSWQLQHIRSQAETLIHFFCPDCGWEKMSLWSFFFVILCHLLKIHFGFYAFYFFIPVTYYCHHWRNGTT